MNNIEIVKKLKSLRLNLEAHPDNEPNSEFEDRISDLDEIIESLSATHEVVEVDAEAFWNEHKQEHDYAGDGHYINKETFLKFAQQFSSASSMHKDFKYCQSEIEDKGKCSEQCDHCKEYYKPLSVSSPKTSEAEDFLEKYVDTNESVEHERGNILTAMTRFAASSPKDNFLPPDHGEACWTFGAETFTRKEVFDMLHTQRAMISNDIKREVNLDGQDILLSIINNPRTPKF